MARRPTSPDLVGRDRELADLLAAVAAEDADRPVVLVTGEAGIGKTRLLSELVNRLGAEPPAVGQTLVARGSCLRLAEGELPFAPILEILDTIQSWDSGLPLRRLYELLDGSGRGHDGAGSADSRTVRFMEIRDALIAGAGQARLAVVIDDLQWADQSTLDLVLFLARRLRGARVILIAAYRSDELHRRHPLRPVVAELSRGYVRERIELGPLDRASVDQQVAALGGAPGDVLAEIAARADGNPFYVEELMALDPGASGLPPSLRDVLLARLALLDEQTGRMLGACALIGHQAGGDLIGQVTGLDAAAVESALRAAVDASILVPDPDGRSYGFRHALLEEAVHDDLLPGDRVELHRRIAEVLQARGGTVPPGELARHLDGAGQVDEAIGAYLQAADLAFRALAWAEGVAAFERAAALDAREGRPGIRPGLQGLVPATANAMNWTGAPNRATALLREWITRTEAARDNAAAAVMWLGLGRILNDNGDEAASRASLVEAMRLFPADESTALGIELLVMRSADAWIPGKSREALRAAERAVAGAERFSDPEVQFRALVHRAVALISLGDLDRGIADVERARRIQAEHGWLDTYGILATNVGITLADIGEIDRSLELLNEGLRMSAELGITRSWDPWNLACLALVEFISGRWADADGSIAAARAYDARGMPAAYNEWVAAHLAAGRGDIEAADRAIAVADAETGDVLGDWHAMLRLARVARADATEDHDRRLDELDVAQRSLEVEGTDSLAIRSRIAAETAAAAADAIDRSHAKRDRRRIDALRARAQAAAQLAVEIDAGRVVAGSRSIRFTQVHAALARAEADRAEGRDDAAAWPPIAEAFREMGMVPRVAYATFRAADAALRADDRSTAQTALLEALSLARSIGMTVLVTRIEALARAARLEVVPRAAPRPKTVSPMDPWGLSTREREVLALLADGRTNGEIGARLFISTKTASVHVTHILDKLGVSSRTEAAILANRAGLVGQA